jgi:hypothetical protein
MRSRNAHTKPLAFLVSIWPGNIRRAVCKQGVNIDFIPIPPPGNIFKNIFPFVLRFRTYYLKSYIRSESSILTENIVRKFYVRFMAIVHEKLPWVLERNIS